MELLKILCVAVVAVILISCIDCKLSQNKSKRSETTEQSVANALKTAGKESAVEIFKQIPNLVPYAINAVKRAMAKSNKASNKTTDNNTTVTIRSGKVDAKGSNTRVYQSTNGGVMGSDKVERPYVDDHSRQESLGDGKTHVPQGDKIPPNAQPEVVAQKSRADVEEGKLLMLTIMSASVILSYGYTIII